MLFKKTTKEGAKTYFRRELGWFGRLLVFSYGVSVVAAAINFSGLLNYFYFLDLLSHFTIQYAIGGFVLGLTLLLVEKRLLAFLCLCIFVLCFIESRWRLHHPFDFVPAKGQEVY